MIAGKSAEKNEGNELSEKSRGKYVRSFIGNRANRDHRE